MLDTMQSFRALMSKTYGAKDQSLVFATVKRHAVFQIAKRPHCVFGFTT